MEVGVSKRPGGRPQTSIGLELQKIQLFVFKQPMCLMFLWKNLVGDVFFPVRSEQHPDSIHKSCPTHASWNQVFLDFDFSGFSEESTVSSCKVFGGLQVAWTFATLRICSGEVLTAAGS